jgi:hypothetical protein
LKNEPVAIPRLYVKKS